MIAYEREVLKGFILFSYLFFPKKNTEPSPIFFVVFHSEFWAVGPVQYCIINLLCLMVSFPRNKKKKIPLMNGEEVDMDLSAME